MIPEDILIPLTVPAITALVIFVSQWHKKGSQIEISGIDIENIKEKMDQIDEKLNKLIEKVNVLTTDVEIFRYRLKIIERLTDEYHGWHGNASREPFRPKDSNGE